MQMTNRMQEIEKLNESMELRATCEDVNDLIIRF